jgi:hypothetical protein
MNLPATDAIYSFDMVSVTTLDGVTEADGVLIIMNSTTLLPNASISIGFSCVSAQGFGYSFELTSTGKYTDGNYVDNDHPSPPIVLVPPILAASVTVNEGDDVSVYCGNLNRPPLLIGFSWLNPRMMPAVEGTFNRLLFTRINRTQAGEYMCVLTSASTGDTISGSTSVVVHCKLLQVNYFIVSVSACSGGMCPMQCACSGRSRVPRFPLNPPLWALAIDLHDLHEQISSVIALQVISIRSNMYCFGKQLVHLYMGNPLPEMSYTELKLFHTCGQQVHMTL